MSNWLSMEVVTTENSDERVALVSRLVDIMVVSLKRDTRGREYNIIITAVFLIRH